MKTQDRFPTLLIGIGTMTLVGCSAASSVSPPTLPVGANPAETAADATMPQSAADADATPPSAASASAGILPSSVELTVDSSELVPGAWPGTLAQSITTAGGFHHQRYKMDVAPGSTTRLWVESPTFDTTLRVVGEGAEFYNDDFWDGTNSFIQFQSLDGGTYAVDVSSYAPGEVGDYTLHVASYTPEKMGQIVELGDEFEAETTPHGRGPGSNGFGASMWFEARAGQQVTARVTSPDFDTTALILGPTGTTWYNDDANDLGPDGTESTLDSTIDFIAPNDGFYQLLVAPYGSGPAGVFKVRTSYREPVVVGPDAEIPEMGYSGQNREGRILGVFVGISAYVSSPLYACDDDASFVFQALRERQMIAKEDTWLLTNANATVENLERALEELADQASPDDTVIVFFSGHGGVIAAEGDDELDGTDETLVLYDGDIRDNQFVGWLDEVESDTMILAIDACQSGGFARDFMTQPGRIGFFSSDEDVLSDTAEVVGAGGYLSYFLREAILGRADHRPADGALTVGELSDYLVDGFVEAHDWMNPPQADDPRQRVLIERGSFNWNDVLWIYPRSLDGQQVDITDVVLHSGNSNQPRSTGSGCRVSGDPTN